MQAVVYSFSRRGAELSKHIRDILVDLGYQVRTETLRKFAAELGLAPMQPDHHGACAQAFLDCQLIVFVGATGIAVRTIAPLLKSKATDPAVLSLDERGSFVIPLVAGHIGGANEAARVLAASLGAQACITTATDVNGLFAIDEWAARNRMILDSLSAAKDFAAALVQGNEVGLYTEYPLQGTLPRQIKLWNREQVPAIGMAVALNKEIHPFSETVNLLPRIVHLGIGCRQGISLEAIEALVLPQLAELKLDHRTIVRIASVDLKMHEQGLLAFAEKYHWPTIFYTAAELQAVQGEFTASKFVQSVIGVSNVCERAAVCSSGQGELLLPKTSLNGVTLAVAREKITLDLNKTGLRNE